MAVDAPFDLHVGDLIPPASADDPAQVDHVKKRAIGWIMVVGAGVLISAVAFDLVGEAAGMARDRGRRTAPGNVVSLASRHR